MTSDEQAMMAGAALGILVGLAVVVFCCPMPAPVQMKVQQTPAKVQHTVGCGRLESPFERIEIEGE